MITNHERGSVIILAILIITWALMATVAILQEVATSAILLTTAAVDRREVVNLAIDSLSSAEPKESPRGRVITRTENFTFGTLPPIGPFQLTSTQSYYREAEARFYQLQKLLKDPTRLPVPDWFYLSHYPGELCQITASVNIDQGSPLVAPHSCVISSLMKDSFIFGNLEAEELTVKPRNHHSVLAIHGAAAIKNLKLTLPANSSLEIIALGDIEIGKLTFSNRDFLSLLIHSVRGKIAVTSSSISLPGDCAIHPFLRFEAMDGVLWEGLNLSQRFGCEKARDPLIWPQDVAIAIWEEY